MEDQGSLKDILQEVVSGMTFPVQIYSNTKTGNSYVLVVDDAYHAQVGFEVTIGAHPYKITAMEGHRKQCYDILTVKDEQTTKMTITVTSFSMYAPHFFYGTVTDTEIQLVQKSESVENVKTPMIWLRIDDTLKENLKNDPQDAIEKVSSCMVYALTEGDHEKLTPEILPASVEPMRRLFNDFIEEIIYRRDYFRSHTFDEDVTYFAKFGVYVSGKGVKSQLFSDTLSGCGGGLSLEIYRGQCCL